MSYRDHVSDESLDIIRANECDAPINLATKRFRRLWNEIESLRARLDEAANDAQRYVWWCDPSNDIPSSVFYQGKPVIDAFIDGAKKAKH